jgi:hypothetical protein
VSLPTTSEMDEMGHRRAKRGSSGPASGVAVRYGNRSAPHLFDPRPIQYLGMEKATTFPTPGGKCK